MRVLHTPGPGVEPDAVADAQRAAERQLRESREAFARAFEDAPIGMSLTAGFDADTRLMRVNAAFCQLFGGTADAVLACRPQSLIHPDDLEAARLPWRRMITGEAQRFAAEHRMVRLDGRVFWASVHGSLVRDADGTPLYAITQVQDVTARREGEHALRAAEERFRTAFDDAGTAMALVSPDIHLLRVNAALCRLLGRDEAELVGADVRTLLHPDEVGEGEARVQALLDDPQRRDSYSREARWLHADGHVVWTRITASLIRDDGGRPLYIVEQIVDMTAERRAREDAERRIAQQSAVAWLGQRALADPDLGALLETAVHVVAATIGSTNAGLAVCEPPDRLRLAAAAGWPAEVIGATVSTDPASGQAAYTLAAGRPVIARDLAADVRFDASALLRAGAASGASCVVAGVGDDPFGVLSVHSTQPRAFTDDDTAFLTSVANVLTGAVRRDATARDLRHQSLHDSLTGLPNRALLLDRLRHGLERARRDGSTLGVLFCDIDDFKYVNDSLGHEAGDRLLAALAPRLGETLRGADTLARFGGDEFIVLCEGVHDAADVVAVGERLLAACARPIDLGGREFVPTASIGIAIAPPDAEPDPEALVRDADVAMYRAKARGKGRYELFDARMRAETLERIALISDLRHAAARGELELEFQPIVSLAHGTVVGVESLVRWRHPERGLLMPGQFVELAEDNGLIHGLGGWVLDEAIRSAAAWRRERTPILAGLVVGVNVSWRQISQASLVDEVVAALAAHGLPGEALCVEVTESALMEDRERAMATLRGLADLGVHLALDDFGTGQSSLSVVRDFPLRGLKLDRAFLAGEGEWPIVEAVCRMAQGMDLEVVAEGIELPEQAERLAALGCDLGQGWLYARAMPADRLAAAVADLATRLRAG